MPNEFEIIDELRRAVGAAPPGVEVGIGDDTAVLAPSVSDGRTLVTVDLIAEGSHFTIPPATARQIGHKALGVNLSDIAAMAGRPTCAFLAVELPRSRGADFARELFAGVQDLARQFDVTLAGGDTNIWDGPLIVSITLMGEITGGRPVLRSGARPGDWLFVTGSLGGSLASGRHLAVRPRILEAQKLHATVDLHALIDLSDGLSRDLRHITVEQGLGACLAAERIPIHPDVPADLPHDVRLQRALDDGEDFELLFAVSPEDGQRLLDSPPIETPLHWIGTVLPDADRCQLDFANGRRVSLEAGGFEHQF